MDSKSKGKRGERLFAQFLSDHGYPACRSGQYQSSANSNDPDVTCPLLGMLWQEVKFREKSEVRKWYAQSLADSAKSQIPTVQWKKANEPWLTILDAENFLLILQHCDLEALEEALKSRS